MITTHLDFPAQLQAAAQQLGLVLTDHQKGQLLEYVAQLDKWNRTYNLTSIRNQQDMLVHHVFDSLAVVPAVNKILGRIRGDTEHAPTQTPVIVDVGSGGGLPGIVLSIAGESDVHCVDAVQKKMTFVQQMAGVLKCRRLFAHHHRIESMPPWEADIVISRAFASLMDFVTLAGRHVASDGVMLAMKGKYPEQEVAHLHQHTDWRVIEQEPLVVPGLAAERCLLHIKNERRKDDHSSKR